MDAITELSEILKNLSISLPLLGVLGLAGAVAAILLKMKKPGENRNQPPAGRDVSLNQPDSHGIVQPAIHDHTGDSGILDDDSTVHVNLPDGSTEIRPAPEGVDDDDLVDVVAIQPTVTDVTRLPDDPAKKPAKPSIPLDEIIQMMKDQGRIDKYADKKDE